MMSLQPTQPSGSLSMFFLIELDNVVMARASAKMVLPNARFATSGSPRPLDSGVALFGIPVSWEFAEPCRSVRMCR